jgi:glutaminyl-peptide cyclotransferase
VLRRFRLQWVIVAAVLAGTVGLTVCAQLRSPAGPEVWTARVIATYPHDPGAFTQGLTVHDGELYESTGQYGHSSLRRVDIDSGAVEQIAPVNFTFFAEGMTIFGGRIYQLTWKSQTAFIYDLATFELLGTRRYSGEGWGLTHDGESLIVSDGSATLFFYEPEGFTVTRTIEVRDQGMPVARLNELEFVNGEIWANIWYEDRIARISPETGEVLAWVDLSLLVPRTRRDPDAVLNGIAYDPAADRLFVTGKYWPQLFEIELIEP